MLKADTLGMHYSLADYRAAIRDLDELAGNYDTAAISVFRITPVTSEAFILEKNNPALTLEMVRDRIEGKQYDDAERYLQILRSQGGTTREINSLRDRIDKALKTGLD